MRSRLLTAVAAALSVASCSSSTTGGEQTTAPPAHYSEPGTSTPSPRAPEATDFRIDVIITSKQCFSAQSCVYSYYVDPWPTASCPAQIPGTKLTVIGFVD